ncbi:MAG: C25 family cysteine peptidase, partial [Ardenticatenaceae bacterium]
MIRTRRPPSGFSPGRLWLTLLVLLLPLLGGCRNVVDNPTPPSPDEPVSRARVGVEGTGLFKVEQRALAGLGWGADDPLTLSLDGSAIPFQRHEGSLYFYLPTSMPARYSNQHTLWLTHGQSLVAADPPGSEQPLSTILAEQRLTGDEQYSPKYVGDPWFWRTLVGPTTDQHELPTPGRQAGPVTVTVRMGGVTATEHDVTVLFEEQEAGAFHWFGDERHEETLSLDLPAGETLNLSIAVPEPEGGADISMVDEIVVRYPTAPVLQEGYFAGLATQAGMAAFDNAGEGTLAWQVEPSLAVLPVEIAGGQARVALPAGDLVVITEARLAAPATVVAAPESSALSTEGAEYLAIVAPPLAEATEPLLAYHREQGLSTLLLTPQEVYDAYSHGTVDPLAFRALLRAAQEQWATPPRFVLLVGDSTYDPLGHKTAPPESYLPSPFVETVYGGETVSDNVLADLDEDGYPDVALGRLPARSPEQIEIYIQKLLAYNNDPAAGAWRQRVLLAADGQDELFKRHSEALLDGIPSNVETLTVYPEAHSDALAEMLPLLNEGSLVVNYVGHGSVQQWGKDQLLTAEEASALSNGNRLPIYINMTCLTGLFSHPQQQSLAESLLWASEGGAIAAIAPTSLTLPTNQTRLNEALLVELFSPDRPAIGEALDRAKQTVPLDTANDHDIVATFNLLGDPA